MVDGNLFNIPLSPPTSPHLSGFQSDSIETTWAEPPKSLEATQAPESNMTLVHSEIPNLTLDTKPMLRAHKSFPFPMGTVVPDTPPLNSSDGSPNTANPEDLSASLDIPSAELHSATFTDSQDSPLDDLRSPSPLDDDIHGGDLGLNITLGEDENGEKKTLSAAELRAQKRKMKRFRLTHNQTRFLMSEFARQAHPDAAHRERLAREIPGLTPRQVQVWFQNRRAKLKRLTSDDRERMMRSRALPDDFDMTQALHSPFGAIQNVNSMSSPGGYSSISDSNMIRPLSLESLRRVDGSHLSPTVPYGGFFTPPQSVTDTMSPVSPAGDSPFPYSPSLDGARRSNPFAGGLASPSTFTSHPIPRLQNMHDRDPRSRAEAMTSPLRPALSYSGQGDMNSPSSPLAGDSNGPSGIMPYSLGYSYPNSSPGFTSPASLSRMRPFPKKIEINSLGGRPIAPSSPMVNGPTTPRSEGGPMSGSHAPTSGSGFPPSMYQTHHLTGYPHSHGHPSFMRQPSPSEQFSHPGDLVDDDDEGVDSLSGF